MYIPLWAAGWSRHLLRPFPAWIIPQGQRGSQRAPQCPITNILCQVIPFRSSLKGNHYGEETKRMLFGSSPHKNTNSHPGSVMVLSVKSRTPRDFRASEITSYLSAVQVEPSAQNMQSFFWRTWCLLWGRKRHTSSTALPESDNCIFLDNFTFSTYPQGTTPTFWCCKGTGQEAALFSLYIQGVQLHTWEKKPHLANQSHASSHQEHLQWSKQTLLFLFFCWVLLPLEQSYLKAVYSKLIDSALKHTETTHKAHYSKSGREATTTFNQAAAEHLEPTQTFLQRFPIG